METNKVSSIFMILLTFLCWLSACSKKCDEFNKDIINWMPYNKSDKIILFNSGAEVTFDVRENVIYHTDKIGRNTKCSCEDTYITELASDAINMIVLFRDSHYVENSTVTVNDEVLRYSNKVDSYFLNGKTYLNSIVYKNTSQNLTKVFDELIISKDLGIIEIFSINGNWVIEDDSYRNVEFSTINFNETNCN